MGFLFSKPQVPSELLLKELLIKLKTKLETGQYNLENNLHIFLAEGIKHKFFDKQYYKNNQQNILNNLNGLNLQNLEETNKTLKIKDLEDFVTTKFNELKNKNNISSKEADNWYRKGIQFAKQIKYYQNEINSDLWYDFHLIFLISYTFSHVKCKQPKQTKVISNTSKKSKSTVLCEAKPSIQIVTNKKCKKPILLSALQSEPKQKKATKSDNKPKTTTPIVVDIDKKLVCNVEKIDEEFGTIGHIIKIYEEAKKFEPQVRLFCSTDGSLEYYVLDENLMKLKELMDRIKCSKDDVEKKIKKIEVINYISILQEILDNNVVD